jgi:hypothetical protein
MSAAASVPRQVPAPPRAAAIAGVVFSALFIVSLVIVRLAVPADPTEPGAILTDPARRNAVGLALHLVPFAGIAFLWFIGVLRNRLGALEDQFFATVMLGSGLLFLATLFGAAALAGGLLDAFAARSPGQAPGETYAFGRATSYTLVNVFAIKMAGVFMITTSTLGLRTAIMPRWVALVGYAFAVVLLLIVTNFEWIALLFPLWVLLLSAYILISDFRK